MLIHRMLKCCCLSATYRLDMHVLVDDHCNNRGLITAITGLITAITGLITAITGLITAITGLITAITGLITAITGLITAITGLITAITKLCPQNKNASISANIHTGSHQACSEQTLCS